MRLLIICLLLVSCQKHESITCTDHASESKPEPTQTIYGNFIGTEQKGYEIKCKGLTAIAECKSLCANFGLKVKEKK